MIHLSNIDLLTGSWGRYLWRWLYSDLFVYLFKYCHFKEYNLMTLLWGFRQVNWSTECNWNLNVIDKSINNLKVLHLQYVFWIIILKITWWWIIDDTIFLDICQLMLAYTYNVWWFRTDICHFSTLQDELLNQLETRNCFSNNFIL